MATRWKRGVQAMRQAISSSPRTQDSLFDAVDRDVRALAKLAKELPKSFQGVVEALRQLWKAQHRLAVELQKIPEALSLSDCFADACTKLVTASCDLEVSKAEQFARDVQLDTLDDLSALDQATKCLEQLRSDRVARSLEYDAARLSTEKRTQELQKKGKGVEDDDIAKQRRQEEEKARDAFRKANQGCIDEMVKIVSGKDLVLRRYAALTVQTLSQSLTDAAAELSSAATALQSCQKAPIRKLQPAFALLKHDDPARAGSDVQSSPSRQMSAMEPDEVAPEAAAAVEEAAAPAAEAAPAAADGSPSDEEES